MEAQIQKPSENRLLIHFTLCSQQDIAKALEVLTLLQDGKLLPEAETERMQKPT